MVPPEQSLPTSPLPHCLLLFHGADCLAKLVAEAENDPDEDIVMTATFIGSII
jgi:hypothetical protein